MESLIILDSTFEKVYELDIYNSLVWVERYQDRGEFELELPIEELHNPYISEGNFIIKESSDRAMMIDDINPVVEEDGSKLLISGYSVETVLDSRTITELLNISGSLQTSVLTLLDDNFISPTITARTLSNFNTITSTDPTITALTTTDQFDGKTVLEIIRHICDGFGLGFRVVLDTATMVFKFSLYNGVDRSYAQSTNPYVIFSREYDNLIEGSYNVINRGFKNVALVVTDDTVLALQRVLIWDGTAPSGWNRREMVVDARDLSRYVDESTQLTDQEFLDVVTQKGLTAIRERSVVELFEAEIDLFRNFNYGEDFYLGDILQCNFEGAQFATRLVEVINTTSPDGNQITAAFDFDI